jgi:hypothetical protein
MSNYAVIKNGIVDNIVVADAEWADAQTDTVVEYTEANPAYMGGEYVGGFFYAPQPFASWTRSSGTWVAPVTMPTSVEENKAWIWNEATVSWINIDVDPMASELPDNFID